MVVYSGTGQRKEGGYLMRRFSIAVGVCSLVGIVVWYAGARMWPHHPLGWSLTWGRFVLGVDRAGALADYATQLRANNQGIPEALDRRLCSRLRRGLDEPEHGSEADLILDFYTDQLLGRESERLLPLGDLAVGRLLQRAETYVRPQQRAKSLLLVEEIRIGRLLYKAKLSSLEMDNLPTTIEQAMIAYKNWWQNSTAPWEAKRRLNPLAGSGLAWVSP